MNAIALIVFALYFRNRREICMCMRRYGPLGTRPVCSHNLFTHCTTLFGGWDPQRRILFWGENKGMLA